MIIKLQWYGFYVTLSLHITCRRNIAVNSNIFWRGLVVGGSSVSTGFWDLVLVLPAKHLECKHFWRRLDQRQWKDLVAQLNGRIPEPGNGTGFGYGALVHTHRGQKAPSCHSRSGCLQSSSQGFQCKSSEMSPGTVENFEVGCIN